MKSPKQAPKKPNSRIKFKSHHERSPGGWLPCDEISLFGRKIAPKPTLAQLDGEKE